MARQTTQVNRPDPISLPSGVRSAARAGTIKQCSSFGIGAWLGVPCGGQTSLVDKELPRMPQPLAALFSSSSDQ